MTKEISQTMNAGADVIEAVTGLYKAGYIALDKKGNKAKAKEAILKYRLAAANMAIAVDALERAINDGEATAKTCNSEGEGI